MKYTPIDQGQVSFYSAVLFRLSRAWNLNRHLNFATVRKSARVIRVLTVDPRL